MVEEAGDSFRDTVALTVRGDGIDIPPYIIVHSYKSASYASGRRCKAGEEPIRGMNVMRMKAYIDHVAQYVEESSLFIMDRLSSHTAGEVRRHLLTKKTKNGDQLLIPIYLPAKTAFLISPLDMGAIGAFKTHFHKLDRSTIDLKLRAIYDAWGEVSNEALVNIFQNCGLVGEDTIPSLHERFKKNIGDLVPTKFEKNQFFFNAWKSGSIEVEGVKRHRGVTLQVPSQLLEGHLDGVYWSKYGGK